MIARTDSILASSSRKIDLLSGSERIVGNWEVTGYRASLSCPNFVRICATNLPILPIEKSTTYLFSMAVFVVPWHKAIVV